MSSSEHSPPLPDIPLTLPSQDLHQLVMSARNIIDQSPPPTLREILGAYRSKGDGDRDMLLAMLNAKTAEDQRLASVAALQRSILDVYRYSSLERTHSSSLPPFHGRRHHHTQSPHIYDQRSRRQHHRRPRSGSRSPPHPPYHANLPSIRDVPMSHPQYIHHNRHHPSVPPLSPPQYYESHVTSQHEHLPPSPYSSSSRSDSIEYSPRSRTSMAIGSLLTPGPSKEVVSHDP